MTTPDLKAADIPRRSRQDKPLKAPTARWHYAYPDGSTAFHICRWDKPDGKLIMPLTWDGTAWCWVGPAAPRPLLYAPALTARPNCPVLLVEGEKTADAARQYLPPGWEPTTWSGGVNALKQSDFTIMAGHPVVIWPDNDAAGITAAAALSEILHGAGVEHAIVALPDLPEKWDLADALPDNLTADGVAVLLARTLADLTAPPVPAAPAAPEYVNGHATDTGIDSDIEILCLGHRNRRFYFIGARSQTVLELNGRDIQDMKGLRELCPDDTYWYRQYGTNAENFNPGKVGAELISKCYATGIYNEGNMRGRGCWIDAGRVVLHAGDRLLVDGVPCEPIAIKSQFVYPKLPRFFDLEHSTPLTAAEGRSLNKIVRSIRWQGRDALTADIFSGFLATMTIAGALRFRSHGWVTGASGSGKSYLVSNIAVRCVGAMSVIPIGSSTEAGIRSQLNSESFPVLFDEAESHGQDGESKRQMIIQMMRISTQDSFGAVFKGSAGHKAASFRVQSQFLLASIGVGLKESADLNRCIVMNLDTPTAATVEEQGQRIAEFAKLDQSVRQLPDDIPQKILLRMLPLVNNVRDLADRLSTRLMRQLGTSTIKRVGDLLATPLAGMWFLTHDAPPTDGQIDQWFSRYNFRPWEGTGEPYQADEAVSLLRHLVDQEVRVEFDHGGGTRAVGAVIAHLAGYDYDSRVATDECKRVLLQHGLKYDTETRGVWVSTRSDALDRLMRHSPFGGSYVGILRRHQEAKLSERPVWMGTKSNRAIWLPVAAFLGERLDGDTYRAPPPGPPAETLDLAPGHPDYYEPGADG